MNRLISALLLLQGCSHLIPHYSLQRGANFEGLRPRSSGADGLLRPMTLQDVFVGGTAVTWVIPHPKQQPAE